MIWEFVTIFFSLLLYTNKVYWNCVLRQAMPISIKAQRFKFVMEKIITSPDLPV